MSEQPATPPGVPQWDTADRMRKALRQSGIGVTEMAVYLGVSRTTASNWLNGRIKPRPIYLKEWARRGESPHHRGRAWRVYSSHEGAPPCPDSSAS